MPETTVAVPERLIDARGEPSLGIFAGPVPVINGRDTALRTPMGGTASRAARHFGYKQFQYFGIVSDELLIGCALADTAWLGLAFAYLYDARSRQLHQHSWRAPLAAGLRMSPSQVNGESLFRRGGRVPARMHYHRDGNRVVRALKLHTPELTLEASMPEGSDFDPMSICTRTGINGWTYTSKAAGLPVQGTLVWRGRHIDLATLDACGVHDFTAGYPGRETFWNWACLAGRVDGHRVGLNLSCGVNETSETENCLWLDGRQTKVDTVHFDYRRGDLMRPWRIRSADGRVSVGFQPEARHRERANAGLLAANFNQLFGRFTGELRLRDDRVLSLDGQYGFVEEQYARW